MKSITITTDLKDVDEPPRELGAVNWLTAALESSASPHLSRLEEVTLQIYNFVDMGLLLQHDELDDILSSSHMSALQAFDFEFVKCCDTLDLDAIRLSLGVTFQQVDARGILGVKQSGTISLETCTHANMIYSTIATRTARGKALEEAYETVGIFTAAPSVICVIDTLRYRHT